MKDGRHIIWSNDIDYDDWREDFWRSSTPTSPKPSVWS